MARFVSVATRNIISGDTTPTVLVSGTSNTSGIPADTYGVLLSITCSNTTVNARNVSVLFTKAGAANATSVLTSGEVPSKSTLEILTGNKIIMGAGDVLSSYASHADCIDVIVSYMLNTQDDTI